MELHETIIFLPSTKGLHGQSREEWLVVRRQSALCAVQTLTQRSQERNCSGGEQGQMVAHAYGTRTLSYGFYMFKVGGATLLELQNSAQNPGFSCNYNATLTALAAN